eukprot:705685-Rhodomonas_salina.1
MGAMRACSSCIATRSSAATHTHLSTRLPQPHQTCGPARAKTVHNDGCGEEETHGFGSGRGGRGQHRRGQT